MMVKGFSKQTLELYKKIEPVLEEAWNKIIMGNHNEATQYVTEIALMVEIEAFLNSKEGV